jgi:hypothetical protein
MDIVESPRERIADSASGVVPLQGSGIVAVAVAGSPAAPLGDVRRPSRQAAANAPQAVRKPRR